MERRNMDKDKFNKAIEINNKIEEYKDHKMALENSNIKYGGGLIFTYNRMHNDVPLKEEIFGKNFLQCYMYALDSKIKELQKELSKLKAKGEDTLSAEEVFRLYETYGFPQEVTKEISEENGFKIDLRKL